MRFKTTVCSAHPNLCPNTKHEAHLNFIKILAITPLNALAYMKK